MPDMSHTISCPAHPGSDDDCTCGLVHRIALATEQEMHAAWRKRAEEAESELAALREAAGRLADQLTVSPEQRQLAHDALLRDEYQPLYGILASWLNLTMPSVVKSITPWLVPSLRPFEEGSNATH